MIGLFSFIGKRLFLASVGLSFLLSGCSSLGVVKQVSENDKDPSFSYDGSYMASVNSRGGRQFLGNGWSIDCSARDFRTEISVNSSEVSWRFGDEEIKAYVDRNGKFKLVAPLDAKLNVTGGTSSDDRMQAVLQGVIHADVMTGRFVYAASQFNGRGCTYPVSYSNV